MTVILVIVIRVATEMTVILIGVVTDMTVILIGVITEMIVILILIVVATFHGLSDVSMHLNYNIATYRCIAISKTEKEYNHQYGYLMK